jgi:phosphotransferase system enzyme I (PtsI)
MAASAVPRVKQMVRNVEIDACARFSRRVMEQSDPARIEEVFADFAARPP